MDTLNIKLKEQLKNYVDKFNADDEEIYSQLITNASAYDFLSQQVPLVELPSKELEETYYFRWWTLRKHWKSTEDGHILTEFLPPVRWSGPHNSINCPSCFHIREARWLKDSEGWLKEYINFWLEGKGDALSYSSWLCYAVLEYCRIKNDYSFGTTRLPLLIDFLEKQKKKHKAPNGLYWSIDDRDGMEYSISGNGLRPTINSYIYADTVAVAELAELAGNKSAAKKYSLEAEALKEKINTVLWDGDFYKTVPWEPEENKNAPEAPSLKQIDVREHIGYIPWCFDIANPSKTKAFRYLLTDEGFLSPTGITTAERSHPRYMEKHDHECLWNGPVWPFATSQVLVGLSKALKCGNNANINRDDYYALLMQYAKSQKRTTKDGKTVNWIDENLHPETGRWLSRDLLETAGWQERKGGYERGKDYNHSLFCDLVLSGLLGIDADENGLPDVNPLIPDNWDYFLVDGVFIGGKEYRISFDRNGTVYGMGKGLKITAK